MGKVFSRLSIASPRVAAEKFVVRTPKTGHTHAMKPLFSRLLFTASALSLPRLSAILALAAMVSHSSLFAETVASQPASALTNWQTALISFRKAGAAIGQNEYAPAQAELSGAVTNLSAPYNGLAAQFLSRLNATLKQSPDREDPVRQKALIQLCAELHAYGAAIHLGSPSGQEADADDDPVHAWRLYESGDSKAALTEYHHKLAEETVDMWSDYYRTQIRLIEQRPGNLTNVSFAQEFVKQHYLKGYEEKADLLGALQELTRVLPYAQNPKEAVAVQQAIIKMLSDLGDGAGRDAWESKLLHDFATDPEACASVHLARGLRAYAKKDYGPALSLLRKVCSEYPDSGAYGDAQYSIGTLFLDQQKYDDAIAEFNKLFASKVNDYAFDLESSDDFRNYRNRAALRISECYEAKQDLPRALEYAELARDHYKYLSYCKSCLREAKENLEQRIARLQAAAKKPN